MHEKGSFILYKCAYIKEAFISINDLQCKYLMVMVNEHVESKMSSFKSNENIHKKEHAGFTIMWAASSEFVSSSIPS